MEPQNRAANLNPPERDREPLTVQNLIIMLILWLCPILSITPLCFWAFGRNENVNKRNLARAMLVLYLAIAVLAAAGFLIHALRG